MFVVFQQGHRHVCPHLAQQTRAGLYAHGTFYPLDRHVAVLAFDTEELVVVGLADGERSLDG